METNDLLNAFRDLDVARLEAIARNVNLSDPALAGKLVEVLRQSGAMVVKMPSTKNEKKRDALRLKCKELLGAGGESEALRDFECHIEDAGLAEHAFREIVSTISTSKIGRKPPDVQAWAVLNRAAKEAEILMGRQREKLEEMVSKESGPVSRHDLALTDEAGSPIDSDAVLSALSCGARLVLFSLAHQHRWFDAQGAIVLPCEVACEDQTIYEAGTHTLLSSKWGTLERAWDCSRLFRARFALRAVPVDGDPSRVYKELTLGPPDELAKLERIAGERLNQLYYQHAMTIRQQPGPLKRLVSEGDTPPHPLPPEKFLSEEEHASCEILSETFCLPFLDDTLSFFGLPLSAWVRGYALLVKRAEAVLPGQLCQATETEILADLTNHGLTAPQARCFLSAVCLQEGSEDLFDTPLIRIRNGNVLLFTPALVAPVLWRVVLSRISSLNRIRVAEGETNKSSVFEGKGKAFEHKMLSLCKKAGLKAQGFSYRLEGTDYDCDLSVLIDDVLFVFECKNYGLAFDHVPSLYYFSKHLKEFADQACRIASDLNDHPELVHAHYGADALWKRVVPVVLQAMPWSRGSANGVFYYDASALRKLLEDGAVGISVSSRVGEGTVQRRHRYPTRRGTLPTAKELLRELDSPAQLRLYKSGWRTEAVCAPLSDSMLLAIPRWRYTEPSLDEKLIALGSSVEEAGRVAKELTVDFPEQMDHVRDQLKRKAPLSEGLPKTSRNDPCPCGSGKKYKKCCAS